jgi:ABC-type branched-subunit amino acid transport system substrate-binding protein
MWLVGVFALSVLSAYAFTVGLLTDTPITGVVWRSTKHQVIVKTWDDLQADLRDWVSENRVKYVHNLSDSFKAAYQLGILKPEFDLVVSVGDLKRAERFGAIYPFLTGERLNQATISVLKALHITEILTLSTDFGFEPALGEDIDVVASIVLVPDTVQISVDKVVSRTLKPEGVRTVVLDLTANLTQKAFLSLGTARMMKEGYAYLVTPQGSHLNPSTNVWGPLMLAEEGLENSTSYEQKQLDNLNWLLANVTSIAAQDIEAEVRAKLSQRACKLLSLQGTKRVEVCTVHGNSTELTSPFRFPGNATSFNPFLPTQVLVSTHSGSKNGDGSIDPNNAISFKGYFTAMKVIKATGYLERFEILTKELDCGVSTTSIAYAKACIKRDNAFGILSVSGYSSAGATAFLEAQKALNDTTPVIGSRTSAIGLKSKTKYPYFVRDIASIELQAAPIVQLLRKDAYTKVNLFYSNETYGIGYAEAVKPALAFNNIEVVTAPEDQLIPASFIQNATNFTNIGESLRKSGVRPLVLLLLPTYNNPFFDHLANNSFTPDDVYCVVCVILNPNLLNGSPDQVAKRMSLIEGSTSPAPSAFIGELGEKARSQMKDDGYEPINASCQIYDTALHAAYALKYMIVSGKDYEDHDVAIKALRETTFYGCTGRVAIDSDSNNRKDQDTDIMNVQRTDEGYVSVVVAVISLTSSQLITEKDPMQWPPGFTSAPKQDRLNYEECPFPEEHRQDFDKGEDLIKFIGFNLIGVTVTLSAILMVRWRHLNRVKQLDAKAEETFADKVVSLGIVIETLQYIGHGPTFNDGEDVLSLLSDYASGGTISAIEFTRGMYWSLLITVLVCIGVWLISCLVLWLNHKEVKHPVLENLTWLAEVSVPLLGNVLFLPFISVLFDVFYCIEAHGVDESSLDYSDSFMFRDCYEDCWTGSHLGFAIAAGIALVIYHPVTVVTRPLWQLYETDLHILTRPTFYLQKSLVDVIIVVIRRTLRKYHQTAHAIVYLVVLGIHLGYSLVRSPYNYVKTNLWQCIALFACMWISLLSTIQMQYSTLTGSVADEALLAGLGSLLRKLYLVLGLTVQVCCIKGLIVTTKHPKLGSMFKFAFTFKNVPPPPGIEHTLHYAEPVKEEFHRNSRVVPSNLSN